MKKLFFAAYNLDLGGIETALVTLLNKLSEKNEFDITLALEKKEGIFLGDLNKNIKIIEYKVSNFKFMPFRKIINLCKRIRIYDEI